ncbi:MAG: sigma-54-dependent Fis family transcriptional regulator [Deltaproteobacteria bacterium]|nr:MAG: sigma-54-dependent Fis family transcriptional regulator [Deltaproteobacteria bacterium]
MQSASIRVLVADDQPYVIDAVRLLLKTEGWQIRAAGSPADLLAALESGEEFDVALMDLNYTRDTTSGQEGLDLLRQLQQIDPALPVVVMTAWGSVETAVEAMRRGARDYVEKPFDNARLLATLRTQVELGRALRRNRRLEEESRLRKEEAPELIARAPAMQPVLQIIERIGPSEANVLITGEHGTGKEVVARRLHAISPRAGRPLLCINAGGLSDGVFESEMFGHVKGAFTDAKQDRIGAFELADGGSLFLDEIANMPLTQQAKLLRVLETGELKRVGSSRTVKVDVRLISATNADVTSETREKRFREDLMYRLNTVEVRLPALRERREDIPLLADHFLRKQSRKYHRTLSGFSPAALQALREYSWPGNVRELEHTVERGLLMARGEQIELDDLRLRTPAAVADLDAMTLEEAERWFIERTLLRCEGNVNKAAEALGLSRSALYRRLQKPDDAG